MASISELMLSDEQSRILDSVMPGGDGWHAYTSSGGGCLDSCPYYSNCSESGPDKVCSTQWAQSEANPTVLAVLFHVINNFDHYNQGDIEISTESRALSGIRQVVSEAQAALAEEDIEEGALKMRMHRYRERNSAAAQQIKRDAISRGRLICESCKIDYFEKYKNLATRIIECHHLIPLSSDEHGGRTKREHLILLCANCHRLAHSRPEPLSLEELQQLVCFGS